MDGFLILSIETATGCGSVSLTEGGFRDGRLRAECSCQPDITYSRRLLGSVAWLIEAAGVHWHDLDGIAVSIGPGSFTGLRIGMAAAKSIAMAAGKPLIGVPTLDALALACSGSDLMIGSVLDARKQQVYAGFYRIGPDGPPRRITGPMVVNPSDLLKHVSEPVLLTGPGAAVYRQSFTGLDNVRILPPMLASPRAAFVGLLAGRMLSEGRTMDPASAAPLYVRASDAEVNLQRKSERSGERIGGAHTSR